MTDTTQPQSRPRRVPADPLAPVLENLDIVLFELFRANMIAGDQVIRGRTFRNCLIEGPAVMLVLPGTHFDDTNFGDADGDIRNLVLRPAGPQKVVGAIPVQDCTFIGCHFHGVGFTGPEAFLQQILALDNSQ